MEQLEELYSTMIGVLFIFSLPSIIAFIIFLVLARNVGRIVTLIRQQNNVLRKFTLQQSAIEKRKNGVPLTNDEQAALYDIQ